MSKSFEILFWKFYFFRIQSWVSLKQQNNSANCAILFCFIYITYVDKLYCK